MPDVIIDCPECGREYKVSEYATVDGMTCLTCGAGLSMPEFERTTDGLKLKKQETLSKTPRMMPATPQPGVPMAATMVPSSEPGDHPVPMGSIHEEVEIKELPKWMSIVVAVLLIGLFVGFQYKADDFDQFLSVYIWARSIFAAAAFILVVLIAYQDALAPGTMCLFIPPYTLFYTASSVESSLLRGLYFGMVVVLLTEIFFLPDESIVLAGGVMFGNMVEYVDGLIVAASDPLK